jgi:hypothetical protein
MRIEVNIEELVLHGFDPGDKYNIAESIERELTLLLSTSGLPRAFDKMTKIDQMDIGSFELRPGLRAETIGSLIGRSVYRGLKR